MKKLILFVFLFSFLRAQETNFTWSGASLFDETNTKLGSTAGPLEPLPGYTALTVFSDLTTLVTSNQIQLSDLLTASFHLDGPSTETLSTIDVADTDSGPPPLQGNYLTEAFFNSGSAYIGNDAYLLIHQGDGNFQVGDFIGLSSSGTQLVDRELLTPQSLDGGVIVTNIEVIPEPTTLLLLLASVSGLIAYRRYARS